MMFWKPFRDKIKSRNTGLDGCLLFYTPDSYDAALKKANQLRLSGVSAELIPVACDQDCRRADLRGRLRREAMLIHADRRLMSS